MDRYVNRVKLEEALRRLGQSAQTEGTIYLTGGATALLLGIREQTIDIDIKLDPEPGGVFQAISEVKVSLSVNVELAAPDQFIPPLPGWQERSLFIGRYGRVNFRHYDFYSQALAKIERGHSQDLSDAKALLDRGLIQLDEMVRLFETIRPEIVKYPGIDAGDFERKLINFVSVHKYE
jgi:hypothetical protein